MSLRLVPKSVTLNGVMAVILRYFSEFGYLPGVLRKSSCSLSHLLIEFLFLLKLCDMSKKTCLFFEFYQRMFSSRVSCKQVAMVTP